MGDGDISDVFDFWRQCARHPRACLDDSRRKLIARAMRWGYSDADLKLAILGCCTDPWYGEGANDRQTVFTHLSLILRDGDHIDKFIKAGEQSIRRAHAQAIEDEERRTRAPKTPMPERLRETVRNIFAPRSTKA
jgi:hypothetical protein